MRVYPVSQEISPRTLEDPKNNAEKPSHKIEQPFLIAPIPALKIPILEEEEEKALPPTMEPSPAKQLEGTLENGKRFTQKKIFQYMKN